MTPEVQTRLALNRALGDLAQVAISLGDAKSFFGDSRKKANAENAESFFEAGAQELETASAALLKAAKGLVAVYDYKAAHELIAELPRFMSENREGGAA